MRKNAKIYLMSLGKFLVKGVISMVNENQALKIDPLFSLKKHIGAIREENWETGSPGQQGFPFNS